MRSTKDRRVNSTSSSRFLDNRLFATCSDDTTIALWDLRKLNTKVCTLHGHTSWVKNIEYDTNTRLLVTSGFDGNVIIWDTNRCTEDGCPHKKFFHTRFLMRMRLTPDCSKMLISTSSGYLLILHDLDLTKSLEVGSYPILRARRTTSSSGKLSFFDYRKSVLKNIKHGDDICFYSGNDSRKKGRKLKDILWKAQ